MVLVDFAYTTNSTYIAHMNKFCLEHESGLQESPCKEQCLGCAIMSGEPEEIDRVEQVKKYAEGVQDIEAYKKALNQSTPDKGFIDLEE